MTRDNIISLLINKCIRREAQMSFSQDAEDLLLCNIINIHKRGFYIDIGALDPIRFSNTMLYYLNGWHGINIDAMPGSMKKFNKIRRRDINIEAGISSSGEDMTYYVYEEPANNTFDKMIMEERLKNNLFPIDEIIIPTYHIMELVEKHLKEKQEIEFLDIDIEGFDSTVISEWNFDKYIPKVIMFEKSNESGSASSDILNKEGYFVMASTIRNDIYVNKEYFDNRFKLRF